MGGFKDLFYVYSYLGKWSKIWLYNIFEMSWNHQLEINSQNIWEKPIGFPQF